MPNDSDSNQTERLQRLERKLDFLMWVVSVQALLIGAVVVRELMKLAGWLILLAAVVVPVLYVFRASLPDWARWLGILFGKVERWFRQKFGDSQSSSLR